MDTTDTNSSKSGLERLEKESPLSTDNPPARLTELALEKARALKNSPPFKNKFLRVYISGKGCEGFSYGINFDDQREENDFAWFQEDFEVVMDHATAQTCRETVIDYGTEEDRCGFTITNPMNETFKGKFWKK